jgi:crotonobetainyl-CoA:carnitine CoA-transferase CaiB-like acyl-CoA transferase
VLDRLGVGYERLSADNPRAIVCSLTGYGQTGPLRDKAGHDLNYLARAGVLGLMGPVDRPPQPPSFQLADVGGGLWSIISILAALRARDATGKGALLDIAMTDGVVPFATATLARLFGGEMPARGAESLIGGIAPYNTYRTADGEHVSLAALEPKFLERFCRGAGVEFDLSALLPGPHQTAFIAKFSSVFAQKTRAEWERFSAEHDCCLEPVLRPDELLEDAQLRARRVFAKIDDPSGSFHEYRTPATPNDLDPPRAPGLGQHTDTILLEAGFSEEQIGELRRANVVG